MCINIVEIMQDMNFLTSNLAKVVLTFCLMGSFINIMRVIPVSIILD